MKGDVFTCRNLLPESVWQKKALLYRERIQEVTVPYRARRMRGKKHPVHDFLFQYYSFSSTKLELWHPGLHIALQKPEQECQLFDELKNHRYYLYSDDHLQVVLPSNKLQFIKRLSWTIALLERMTERAPRFACFGLHEWAMIEDASLMRRHQDFPLRVSRKELHEVLGSLALNCSHYDAFRFFTQANKPKNKKPLHSGERLLNEQSGCIHANMDLYKWCFMYSPWISGDLLLECFLLALEARAVDMRASPYELSELGYPAIKIETPEGREQFVQEQRKLQQKAMPLRAEILAQLKAIRTACSNREDGASLAAASA